MKTNQQFTKSFFTERTNSIDSGYVESNSCDTKNENSVKKKRRPRTSSVQKHQCDICERFLATRQALETHILAHRGERPFKCDYELCEYATTTKQNLASHRKRKHINPIEGCKLCGRKIRDIEEHMRKIHPEKPDVLSFDNQMDDKHIDNFIKCSICDESFTSGEKLKEHERAHSPVFSVICEICDLECDSDGAKNEHKTKMHYL